MAKCCYCGKEIKINEENNPDDWSSNFWEKHSKDDVCCIDCNIDIVIPGRLRAIGGKAVC